MVDRESRLVQQHRVSQPKQQWLTHLWVKSCFSTAIPYEYMVPSKTYGSCKDDGGRPFITWSNLSSTSIAVGRFAGSAFSNDSRMSSISEIDDYWAKEMILIIRSTSNKSRGIPWKRPVPSPVAKCPNEKDSRIALFLIALALAFVRSHCTTLGNLSIDDPQAKNLPESQLRARNQWGKLEVASSVA